MRKHIFSIFAIAVIFQMSFAQGESFKSIAETPDTFNSGNLVARMVKGLGFRYYWATEGLRTEDLNFEPGNEARTSLQTIQHIYGLSEFLLSALEKRVFTGVDVSKFEFVELRSRTFTNLEKCVNILEASSNEDFKGYNIKFQDGRELPFWNAVNGPISDALWHTGQVVMLRRMSGNPFPKGVSVLSGTRN